jgi:hypothetical protein
MKPFTTPQQMIDAHEMMFGPAGRIGAELVIKHAATLFAAPLETLNIRVVLAPVELGPYNKHLGYCYGGEGEAAFILGNRHMVEFSSGSLALESLRFEDFVVHELTHHRQRQLRAGDPSLGERKRGGAHRTADWFAAVAEAAPRYLGIEVPEAIWPTGARTRKGTLTEVEMTHWPDSLRMLRDTGDPRLSS